MMINRGDSNRGGAPLTTILQRGITGHDEIDWSDNLVHSLDVANSWIQFRVQEQDPFHHFPVRLLSILHRVVTLGRRFGDHLDLEMRNGGF